MAFPLAFSARSSLLSKSIRISPRPSISSAAASYATQASPAFSLAQTKSGLRVASNDEGSPTSAITVAIKAGSRYEPSPGVAHVVKNFVFKATTKRSALRVVREAELAGGVLSTSLSREHLFLTAEFLRGDEPLFAELLGDVLTSSKFEPWEYYDSVLPLLSAEYKQAISQPSAYAIDLAHQIAFRTGLGNSLFASPSVHVSPEEAAVFARRSFASQGDIAVVGTGVDGKKLTGLAEELFVPRSSAAEPPAAATTASGYHGGESRVPLTSHGSGDVGHFLLGFQGGSLSDLPSFSVLRHLLGGESSIKWSSGVSPLSRLAASSSSPSSSASVAAFNLSYSDAGLFGFYVTAPTDRVKGALQGALAELKKVAAGSGIGEEDIKRAVAKAKFEAASGLEERVSRLELTGARTLANTPVTADEVLSKLDSVKAADVAKAAAAALKSKPTAVALGDTHKLPWADEL